MSAVPFKQTLVQAALAGGRAVLGRRFADLSRSLDEAQWLPPEELQNRQELRLRKLLEHALANVPFYHALKLEVESKTPLADLRSFPVLNKADYRSADEESLYASNIPAYRRIDRTTSGSTGEPFRFSIDRAALPVIFASHLFYDSWFGFRPFERYVRIVSPPAPGSDLPATTPFSFRIRQAATSRLQKLYESWTQEKITVWDVNPEMVEKIYRRMEAFRPEFVLGYTSTLAVVADELLQRGFRLTRPVRGVVTIAETLSPARRKLIQDYFQAPIINRYGMREFGSWSAQSCPASPEQFHINTELAVCEVLREDGTPAEPGETGRVVLTDLWNFARPFIRYFTGDMAIAGPAETCACGRGFPRLGAIEGRSEECVQTPSGKIISPAILGHYLFVYHPNLDSVRHYQLVQEAPDRLRLIVVPSNRWTEESRLALAGALDKLLAGEMRVTVETADDIPTERSGKRPIIKMAPGATATEGGSVGPDYG